MENLKEKLTNEESFVLKHMVRSMEQQGVHLPEDSKVFLPLFIHQKFNFGLDEI